MLQIKHLTISVDDKQIVKDFSLTLKKGEVIAISGPNGSGKSSLVQFLAGNPKFKKVSGEVKLAGRNLARMKPEKRLREGIFISFQKAIEIPGVSTAQVLRASLNAVRKYKKQQPIDIATFHKLVKPFFEIVDLDPKFLSRDFNCGFSGGESKKLEFIQYLLLVPKLAIFDEVDSGLDTKSTNKIIDYIKNKKPKDQSIIIVTHDPNLVKSIKPNRTIVIPAKAGIQDLDPASSAG